jgi:tetratricopeptide (TPR) repeat protein
MCSDPSEDLTFQLTNLCSDIANSRGGLELLRSNFDKAQKCFEDAISLRRRLGGTDHELIYMIRNVGIASLSANRVQEAHRAFDEAMEMLEQQLPADKDSRLFRIRLAELHASLSCVYMAQGNFKEAWKAATESADVCKQVHAPEGLLMSVYVPVCRSGSSYNLLFWPRLTCASCSCITTLGKIRLCERNHDHAEVLLLKALEMRTKTQGASEETALALHNYACVLESKGSLPEAM